MNLVRQARSAVQMIIILTILTGIIYPLLMTALAQAILPAQANGSLVRDDKGNLIGSTLIGQNFSDPRYFHPRPSAAGDNGYDPLNSGGSNLGPTNEKLIATVADRAAAYRKENGLPSDAPVPVDAVTASGSGLDPDITPANAFLQVPRVAAARNLSEGDVRALVERHIIGRTLWVFGEPRVNVLELNFDLDKRALR